MGFKQRQVWPHHVHGGHVCTRSPTRLRRMARELPRFQAQALGELHFQLLGAGRPRFRLSSPRYITSDIVSNTIFLCTPAARRFPAATTSGTLSAPDSLRATPSAVPACYQTLNDPQNPPQPPYLANVPWISASKRGLSKKTLRDFPISNASQGQAQSPHRRCG